MKHKQRICLCLAAALVLALVPCARAQQGCAIPINTGFASMLIDEAGEVLVPMGKYATIDLVYESPDGPQGDLFMAYGAKREADGDDASGEAAGDGCAMLGGDGQMIGDERYTYFLVEDDGDIFFTQNGLTGVMDKARKVIVPCEYTSIVSNGEGGYLALTTDPYDDKPDGVYYLDGQGGESATGIRIRYDLSFFSEGLMAVTSADSERMGYLNPQGQWAVPPQFNYCGPFVGGRAEAGMDSGVGLIDPSGNWLLTPKYMSVILSGKADGLLVAQLSLNEVQRLDPETYAPVQTFTGTDLFCSGFIDDDLLVLYDAESTRLIGADGVALVEAGPAANFEAYTKQYDRAILREGNWGEACVYLIDLSGQKIAGPYQDIVQVSAYGAEPYYAVSTFDTELVKMPQEEWSYLNEISGTRKMGLIDRAGREILPQDAYTDISWARDGFLTASKDGEVGVVDISGRWIVRQAIEP